MTGERLLVLRFRDIEVGSGETVRLHRRAITEHGACWWGWLSRQHERNPHEDLRELVSELPPTFHVALLDTGLGRVYLATCGEVRAFIDELRSPDLDLTPAYYRPRAARAWFRFTEITDSDATLLVGKTCVGLPSASDECYTDVLGKTVQDVRQLRRQEVTMWLLA